MNATTPREVSGHKSLAAPSSDAVQTSSLEGALEAATGAAINAATKVVGDRFPMEWDGRLAKKRLPEALLSDKRYAVIFMLPKIFYNLRLFIASELATVWLWGGIESRQVRHEGDVRYIRFRLKEFGGSETISTMVPWRLKSNAELLSTMSSAESIRDARWKYLRAEVEAAIQKNAGRDTWNSLTPDNEGKINHPMVSLENYQVSKSSYFQHGESLTSSDAFAAMGSCAIRSYLTARIIKKSGDNGIYIRPLSVKTRVWDDYDFEDSTGVSIRSVQDAAKDKDFSGLFSYSQYLGSWEDISNGEMISLSNLDYRNFSEVFKKQYNKYAEASGSKRMLVCKNFHSVSDYLSQDVSGQGEYPLYGVTAQ
jgi:hypothetical protein